MSGETSFTWVTCPHCGKKLFKDFGSKNINIVTWCKGCKGEVPVRIIKSQLT